MNNMLMKLNNLNKYSISIKSMFNIWMVSSEKFNKWSRFIANVDKIRLLTVENHRWWMIFGVLVEGDLMKRSEGEEEEEEEVKRVWEVEEEEVDRRGRLTVHRELSS